MTTKLELELECGDTSLEPRRVSAHETMSDLFVVDVLLRSPDPNVDLGAIVGKGAGIAAEVSSGLVAWTGVCNFMELLRAAEESDGRSTYRLRIVPAMWLLTQRRGYRIFQHQTIPDVVKKVLGEYRIEPRLELEATYAKQEYCVQYDETDFAFVSRLCEEAGISYYFERRKVGDKAESQLVLSDGPHRHEPSAAIDYYERANEGMLEGLYVTDVQICHGVRSGKVTLRDFDFRKPPLDLLDASELALGKGNEEELEYEQYHYVPGASLYETASAPDKLDVADDKSIARHVKAENKAWATRRAEGARAGKRCVRFRTNHASLPPAKVFTIQRHPRARLGDEKLLVIESHTFFTELDWQVIGTAALAREPRRPEPRTKKPVAGAQTAMVVGPPGSEIHTDEYGRVRVRFHWDREGNYDDNASCWLRVSQAWAGRAFGTEHIPRVSQEVIVDFLDGDPDQPIVVGRLFNVTAQVPRKLPEHDTQSIWRTATSPQSDGRFNEIMLDDRAGKELYFVQAQRDFLRLVKRNDTERTGEDRTIVVGEGRVSAVAGADSLQVGKELLVRMVTAGNLKIPEMGDPEVQPTPTFVQMVDEKITLTTGAATIELAGANIAVHAKGGLRFTTDGRLIIKGSTVFLNVMPGQAQPQADKKVGDAVRKPDRMIGSVEKLFWQPTLAQLQRKDTQVPLTKRPRPQGPPKPPELSCRELWAKYDKQAKDLIAPAGNDPIERNKIISGAYADIYMKHPEFRWCGLAAYASKQAGCGMQHAEALKQKWYVPSGVADYSKNVLAKGNKDIFLDIYPTHRFYEEQGAAKLRECGKERDEYPLTEDSVRAFESLDKYKQTGDQKYLAEHTGRIADHEQRFLLQKNIYSSRTFQGMLIGAKQGSKFTSLAPPIELVLEPGCTGDRKSVFQGWDLANVDQRMKWINGDAMTKYNELLNDSATHLKQLDVIRSRGVAAGAKY
jgi:type VI secretion system secreted protein VgrG